MSLSVAEVAAIAEHPEWVQEADELALTKKSLIADSEKMRALCGDFGRAIIEVAAARRSAAGKLPAAWIFSSEAAQQATPFVVAAARAKRLAEYGAEAVADVTCSIGTEVAALDSEGVGVVGSDIDPARLAMARHNVGKAIFAQADALVPAFDAPVIVADPARRAGGRRITNPEDLLPPLSKLIEAWPNRELAIKCAPGLDFSDWSGEVALTSVDGSVKEACLYTPGLAGVNGRQQVTRSATVIEHVDKHDSLSLSAARVTTYDDTMPDDVDVRAAGRYIIDPDGAVVRAGLVRHFAATHGLWQLDERIAHVSGDTLPEGVAGFEVIEQVGLKQVRKALAALDCGSAEILVRGVDVNPDVLRKQWKLKGANALAVVVTRIGRSATAFICKAREVG
ncbi:MAG: SAM-dependent methyltransferase [Corynebacterium sp.]|uniref:THUMP-like domain-containing protein n=1 Tax=Corynebacterium sp. TaxID=1720 RepID=UPI0026DD0ABC|nr:SAM-dependent methyltransferase [Corynebacterium sp.]MDO5029385.1 SAM-dependent methyltransferase [Corynebacterium sp.]